MKRKFYIMHTVRDTLTGDVRHERVNMRSYALETAKRKADMIRGAFVAPLGSLSPIYVGVCQ